MFIEYIKLFFRYEDFVRLYDAFGVPEGEREQQGEGEKPEGEGNDGESAPVAASGDVKKKFRLQASLIKHSDLCRE